MLLFLFGSGTLMLIMLVRHMPAHTSREVLVIMGSLTTCDPGDINKTIAQVHPNSPLKVSLAKPNLLEIICSTVPILTVQYSKKKLCE
jgi:hypothetical protein